MDLLLLRSICCLVGLIIDNKTGCTMPSRLQSSESQATGRRLKIGIFFSNPGIGGAESFCLSVVPEWNSEGHDAVIVNLWEGGGALKHRCEELNIPFAALSCGTKAFRFGAVKQLRRFFKENKFDIVLIFGLRLQLLMRLTKPLLGSQAIWITMLRGADPWRRWPHIIADRWTQRACQ